MKNNSPLQKHITTELNHADLIKHAFFNDYQLPKELGIINLTQERILMTIKNSMSFTMVSIARTIGLEKGPFSQSVDKLEKLDLVEKVRSTTDKRKIQLKLTIKGEEFTAKVKQSMEDHFLIKLNTLSPEDLNELYKSLESLKKIANILLSK